MAAHKLKKRTICVITGSRADYGLLKGVIGEIKNDPALNLMLLATGMHCSKKHGLTYKFIERDGYKIVQKVPMLINDDSQAGVAKSIGLGCAGFSDVFKEKRPDIVLVLGDRYEILSVVIAAYIANIPIGHIHGGEVTAGAIDEGVRHSITKMATIHFATTETYRKRIVQLGENPQTVFNFGAPGLDAIKRVEMFKKEEISKELDLDLSGSTALVTFHPETLGEKSLKIQVNTMLKAIHDSSINAVFTLANADPRGDMINGQIKRFCATNTKKYKFVNNLGQTKYFSCLKHLDLMIGNSSSGLIEAPSFKMPVVNIGDRQKQRLKAGNVIDVKADYEDIVKGIKKALSNSFKEKLINLKNPYQRFTMGNASKHIKDKLKNLKLDGATLKKGFYDVSFKVA